MGGWCEPGDYAEQRGYVVRYTAEQIRNWRVSRVNGRSLVTLVVLHEVVAESSEDGFDIVEIEQLRVLRLVEARRAIGKGAQRTARPTELRYLVEIWRKVLADGHQKQSSRQKPEGMGIESSCVSLRY